MCKKLILFLFVLIFTGCKNQEESTIKPIIEGKPAARITLYNTKADYPIEKIDLSEFVDSVKFIRLETTEESLINGINKVLFIDKEIVIADHRGGKILVFDAEGRYIRKIADRGRGPGEYLSITSCNYDNTREILSIYDGIGQKLLLYRTDGEFIKDIPVKVGEGSMVIVVYEMINLPNGNYLCYNNALFENTGNYSGLWEIDSEGTFVKSLFRYDIMVPTMFAQPTYYFQQLTDGTISIRDIMHHDIYHYKDGGLKRYVSYEIKDSKLVKYQGNPVPDESFMYCLSSHESSGYIISSWADENWDIVFGLYDKRQNKIRFAETFDNSGLDAVWTEGRTNSNRDNILIVRLPGTRIEQMLSDESTSEKTRKLLNTLKDNRSGTEMESMNPILELLYLKK